MNKVKEIRLRKGLTQEEIAQKTGISRPYLSDIETGKRKIYKSVTMEKIANALGENITDIFFM